MLKESEPFTPNTTTLRIVSNCIDKIKSDNEGLVNWLDSYTKYHKKRIAFDIDLILKNLPLNTKVLEFGSIPLLFTSALSECGYDVTGVDLAPERFATSISQLNLSVLKCNIEKEKLPFDDKSFNAIIFNELFEHLRINPNSTMREVFRILKPNGILFLSSPNLKSLDGILNYLMKDQAYSCSGNIYDEYEKLDKLGHMGHVREYTKTEVINYFERIGFVIDKIIYRGELSSKERNLIARFRPSLRPFITYIMRKPSKITNTLT